MIAFLLVYLIDNAQEGRSAIERGAKKMGFRFSAGVEARLDAVRHVAAAVPPGGGIGVVTVRGTEHALRLRIVE
jgi:hypothetical protein